MRPAVTAGLSAAPRIIALSFIPHGFLVCGFMGLSGLLGPQSAVAAPPANVDSQRLVDADKDPGNWMSYGRTYSEQRFSPLIRINAAYAWHYQATPGEEWDYDAAQQLILADLTIDGQPRQVLIQANKNGFLYVLDRKSGRLISANAFTPVSWARGIDPASGRPIEAPDSHAVDQQPADIADVARLVPCILRR
jgi:glucose dehydrogenase